MNIFGIPEDAIAMVRNEESAREAMNESIRQDIHERHERNRLEKDSHQAQIDSLPVQKETLAETKKNVQVAVHSARVALVSAVIAVVALVCQIVFFLLLR